MKSEKTLQKKISIALVEDISESKPKKDNYNLLWLGVPIIVAGYLIYNQQQPEIITIDKPAEPVKHDEEPVKPCPLKFGKEKKI